MGKKSNRNKAVALKYNAEIDDAPVVIASGYGSVADKIIDVAEQNGVPVYRDDSAASLLCMLEVGGSIPAELYEVVAAIYCELIKTANNIKETSANNNSYGRMRVDRVNE
ncbi:MAG: EscU/YscU/HrcU family type III secretion system export apparatus switch protein [Ruminococcus sp.]|jgi:FlhB-like protein|nr:EscU/YscU/HrcU family type III secretion system export apparatus switch protein [Ruminococcus sp.]